jgi:hypothetical protein
MINRRPAGAYVISYPQVLLHVLQAVVFVHIGALPALRRSAFIDRTMMVMLPRTAVVALCCALQLPPFAQALENGVGRTPALGWSSWNYFENDINETLVLEIASALGAWPFILHGSRPPRCLRKTPTRSRDSRPVPKRAAGDERLPWAHGPKAQRHYRVLTWPSF